MEEQKYKEYLKKIENAISSLEIYECNDINQFKSMINFISTVNKIKFKLDNEIKTLNFEELNDNQKEEITSKLDDFRNSYEDLIADGLRNIVSKEEKFFNSFSEFANQIEEKVDKVEKDSKSILPQIITFSSLFVAVISLVVTNISIIPDFTLKSLLLINLSFILAIATIFFVFYLLWSNSLFKDHNKWFVFISFLTLIIALIIAIICISCYVI